MPTAVLILANLQVACDPSCLLDNCDPSCLLDNTERRFGTCRCCDPRPSAQSPIGSIRATKGWMIPAASRAAWSD
jgi:hypothetical protein